MLAKGILLSILVVLLAVVAIAALVSGIAKRRTKKMRNLCIGVFFGCLLLAVVAGGYLLFMTIKVSHRTLIERGYIDELQNDFFTSSPLIDTLKSYEPEKTITPAFFYSYGGYRDYYRMALVYPYSLICIDDIDNACINDEREVTNIMIDSKKSRQIMSGVEYFTFDRNMLLAKTIDAYQKEEFVLLIYEPRRIAEFDSEAEMKQYAAQHGFDTTRRMKSVHDYYYNSRNFLK